MAAAEEDEEEDATAATGFCTAPNTVVEDLGGGAGAGRVPGRGGSTARLAIMQALPLKI